MLFIDPNAAAIRPNLWLGGSSNEKDADDLQSKGVTHILQVGRELSPTHPDKFQYLRISIDDHEQEDIVKYFPRSMKFIHDAINSGGTVLVHCMAGMSRSASMCIAYLAWGEGLAYDAAFKAVKSARACVSPNLGFIFQLQDYIAAGCQADEWRGWNKNVFAERLRSYRACHTKDTPGIRSRIRMHRAALERAHDAKRLGNRRKTRRPI